MYKCVLDTNILISGIFWGGKPGRIIELAYENKILMITSEECYRELLDKLKNKFIVPGDIINDLVKVIFSRSVFVKPQIKIDLSEDKSDNKFLSVCVVSKADYFITGNTRHFPKNVKDTMDKLYKVKIVNASEFLNLVQI